ncbi:hypothetical protein SAMN05443999_103136 [Roseovarius azorensis]|uniref:Phosphoadenosine phosphosulfate reductase n=1 Tax=Roseovarius azorensis TaxID=1287727 RepID=A0A1H7LU67_9RHOB|nr:phosphoadenosine phosphosulfate reductase [Roseovarius azorensis]SEL02480.1 hypothetical protein SAMN05443999_103136 [Roseovarius azorensis]
MQNSSTIISSDLSGLGWQAWRDRAAELVEREGYAVPLGRKHAAILIRRKSTLLVTFETHARMAELSPEAHPLGWTMVKGLEWSHLCLVSEEDTWFRDQRVYGFFDRLIDEGFFDNFDQVIFYGAGPCGYAAAAFSVAAPGAKVVMLRPQATLDPERSEWDDRYIRMRRTSFTDRFGYAPDMLDGAAEAVLLYDPEVELDAMHAALFSHPKLLRFRTRFLGYRIEPELLQMRVLLRILAQTASGKLTRSSLARLFRARRNAPCYLTRLLQELMAEERDHLTILLCQNVLARELGGPRFRKALQLAETRLQVQQG